MHAPAIFDSVHEIAMDVRAFAWEVDTACKRHGIDPDALTLREKIASDVRAVFSGRTKASIAVLPVPSSDGSYVKLGQAVVAGMSRSARPRQIAVGIISDNEDVKRGTVRVPESGGLVSRKFFAATREKNAVSFMLKTIAALRSDGATLILSRDRGVVLTRAERAMERVKLVAPSDYRRLASKRQTLLRSWKAREFETIDEIGSVVIGISMAFDGAREKHRTLEIDRAYTKSATFNEMLRKVGPLLPANRELYAKLADVVDVMVGEIPRAMKLDPFFARLPDFGEQILPLVRGAVQYAKLSGQYPEVFASASTTSLADAMRVMGFADEEHPMFAWARDSRLTLAALLGEAAVDA